MKTAGLAVCAFLLRLVAADCHGDNCANHVTGTFAGIGVPLSARISLCNDFLKTTIRPPRSTVTRTITKFILHSSQTTTSAANWSTNSSIWVTGSSGTAASPTTRTVSASSGAIETITPSVVPTFAVEQCPDNGQFASACKCWSRVTPRISTIRASTVTVSTTVLVNIGCSPAATAVSNRTRFPCSSGFGMCSCLRTGDGEGDGDSGVCVRVGSGFWDDPGGSSSPEGSGDSASWDEDSVRSGLEYDDEGDVSPANLNVTGPCWFARECSVDNSCRGQGNVCVFDNSCACGKRRCYKAVAGCKGLELPSYESNGAL